MMKRMIEGMAKKTNFLLAALLCAAFVPPALAASYVPGEALVVFRKAPGDGVTAASVERGSESFRLAALAAASGARVAQAYGALSEAGDGVFALVRSETKTAEQLVEDLRARADVLAASPNRISRIMREPNDPRYVSGELWGMAAIRAPEAWDAATGSTDVYVAVADTGIYAAHEDLQPNLDMGLSRNFARAEGAAVDRSDYIDVHGHGTHVAGTIEAVGNNSLGVAGVSWTTRLFVRVYPIVHFLYPLLKPRIMLSSLASCCVCMSLRRLMDVLTVLKLVSMPPSQRCST